MGLRFTLGADTSERNTQEPVASPVSASPFIARVWHRLHQGGNPKGDHAGQDQVLSKGSWILKHDSEVLGLVPVVLLIV